MTTCRWKGRLRQPQDVLLSRQSGGERHSHAHPGDARRAGLHIRSGHPGGRRPATPAWSGAEARRRRARSAWPGDGVLLWLNPFSEHSIFPSADFPSPPARAIISENGVRNRLADMRIQR